MTDVYDTTDWILHTTCGTFRGGGEHRELCHCQPDDRSPEERLRCLPCAICGLKITNGHTKWRQILCGPCKDRARPINEAAGRCLIPIGIHSIVNGMALQVGAGGITDAQAIAVADQLKAVLGAAGGLQKYGETLIKRRAAELDLPELVPFDDYVVACHEAGITWESSWDAILGELSKG